MTGSSSPICIPIEIQICPKTPGFLTPFLSYDLWGMGCFDHQSYGSGFLGILQLTTSFKTWPGLIPQMEVTFSARHEARSPTFWSISEVTTWRTSGYYIVSNSSYFKKKPLRLYWKISVTGVCRNVGKMILVSSWCLAIPPNQLDKVTTYCPKWWWQDLPWYKATKTP